MATARRLRGGAGGVAAPDARSGRGDLRILGRHWHVGYVSRDEDRTFHAVIDGQNGPAYDGIGAIVFAPGGPRFAYRARKGQSWVLVADGREGDEYDAIPLDPIFSPDGKSVYYAARKGEGCMIVAGSKAGPPFSDIASMPVISRDGKHVGYAAIKGDHRFAVIDGVQGSLYRGIGGITFSANWESSAYVAQLSGTFRLVHNGQACMPYYGIELFAFNPDGKRFAYVGKRGNGASVVDMDGRFSSEYRQVDQLLYSPDGNHLAYIAHRQAAGDCLVMQDLTKLAEYEHAWSLTYSPDAKRLAFCARVSSPAARAFVVLDSNEGPAYEAVGEPTFSPNGAHVAYIARQGGGCFVVRDGQADGDSLGDCDLNPASGQKACFVAFSPDSTHLACARFARWGQARRMASRRAAIRGVWARCLVPRRASIRRIIARCMLARQPAIRREAGRRTCFSTGSLLPLGQTLDQASFSPDSRHFAYVTLAEGQYWLVLDGRPIAPYERVVAPLQWTADSLTLLGLKSPSRGAAPFASALVQLICRLQ